MSLSLFSSSEASHQVQPTLRVKGIRFPSRKEQCQRICRHIFKTSTLSPCPVVTCDLWVNLTGLTSAFLGPQFSTSVLRFSWQPPCLQVSSRRRLQTLQLQSPISHTLTGPTWQWQHHSMGAMCWPHLFTCWSSGWRI